MATMEVLQWLQESYWTSSNTFFSVNLPATTWGTKNPNHVANMSFEDIDSFNQGKDGVFMPHLNISSLNIRDLSQPMTSAANLGLATGFLLVVLLNSRFETIKREWRGEYQQWAEIVLARTVFVIACLLLFLAATPLVVLIFIVLMFYRQNVQVILWLVHGKRFAGLMEGADTVWALEDDTSKSVINILAMLQVSSTDESLGEGLLTSLRQLVLSRVLTSPQRCPKLLYYRRKSALGYFYWERQNELHLENHIRWMETGMSISDGISEEILGGVISELANAPLPDQHASSWEILVGRNFISEPNMNVKTSLEEGMSGKYNKQKYPVLFRVHHSLGDGVALLQLLMKTLVDVCNENKNISATPLRKTVLTTVRAMESLGIPIQNKDDLVVDKLQNKVKRPDSPFEKYQNVKPVKHSFKAVTKDISSTMPNRDTINPTFPACKQHSKQLNYNSTGTKMSSIPQYLANPSNKMKVEESETSKEIKNKSIPSASLQFKSDVVYSKTNTKLPCYSASDSYITIIDDTKGAPVQTNNQNMKVYFKNPLSKSAIHSDCTNLEHTNKIQPNMQSLRHRKNSTKGEEKSKSASVISKVLYHNGNIEPAVSTNMERSKDNTSKCSFSNQMQHLNKTNTGPPLDMEVLKLALIPKSAERNSLPIITCTSATPNSKISVTPMYTQRSSPIHIKQVPVVESTNSPYFDSRTPRCLSPMSGFSSSSSSSSTSDSSYHRSRSPMFDKETPRCSSALSGFVNPDFSSAISDNSHHRSKSPMFDNRPPRCSSAMSGFVNPDFPSAIPDNSHHRSQSPMFDNRTPRCSSALSGYITSDCSSAKPDSSNHRSQSSTFDNRTPRCSSAMSGYITSDCSSAIPNGSNHQSQLPMFDKETPRCSSAMSGFITPDFSPPISNKTNHRNCFSRLQNDSSHSSSQKLCLTKYNDKLSKHTKLSFSNINPPLRRGSPSRLDLNTDKPVTFISSGSRPDYLSSYQNTLEANNFPSNYKQICDNQSFAAVVAGSHEYQPRTSTNVEQEKNLSKELKDIKNDSLFTTIPLDLIEKRPMTPTDHCYKISSSLGGWQVLKNMFSKKKSNKMFVKKTKSTSSSNKYVKLLSTINNGEVSKYRCIGNFMHVICAIIYAPASLLHQALMKASDANTLHGPSLSGQKVIAWYTDSSTSTLDDECQLLNTIKLIKSRAMCEARFTDIFLTALSSSLEAYFVTGGSNGNTVPKSINVVVPLRMEPFPTKAVEIIKGEDSSKVLKNVSVEDPTQFMPTILEDLNELNHNYVVTGKKLNSILKNRSFTKDINPGLTFVDISEDKTSNNLLLDNRFSVALMTLPIVPPSCATSEKIPKSYTLRSRLKEVCVQSELLRKSLDYQINYWLMRIVATVLPAALLSPVLRSTQSTMVVSNMKGPAEDIQIGGYKLTDLVFWVPNRGTTGVGVTLMSYAGRLQIGIIADRAVVPCRQDAQLILQGVVSELKHLDAMTSVPHQKRLEVQQIKKKAAHIKLDMRRKYFLRLIFSNNCKPIKLISH